MVILGVLCDRCHVLTLYDKSVLDVEAGQRLCGSCADKVVAERGGDSRIVTGGGDGGQEDQ